MSLRKIGVLWINKKEGKKTYMSGVLKDLRGDIPVVVFKNDEKEGKQPDYNVYLSEPGE